MEHLHRKKHKKKDKKPLYILVGTFIFFGIFIYLLTRPSLQSKAIEQIQVCSNVNDVKSLYDRYKLELLETDENGSKIVALEFQDAVRKKLSELNLNEEELNKCLEWIPPSKTSLNVIIIPDLSKRIIDTKNNPNQIYNDIMVLNTIWNSFVEYSKLKQDTKDKLMLDVTDIDQAKGQFSKIADKLQFDLSSHKGKSNRLFFTDEKNRQFKNAVNELYKSAKDKPLGADYRFYLRRYLERRLKKPTLFDNYINKIIIITDGYLEPQTKPADTKIYGFESELRQAVRDNNILQVINSKGLSIPTENIDLSNSEILVCEVNERKTGKGFDYEILKTYWYDWLTRMKAKKIVFLEREQANEFTRKSVIDFIKN